MLSYLYILSKSVDQICFWRFWYHVTDRSLSRKCESCDVLRFLSISNDCWFARKPVFVGKQQSCQNKLYRNINEQIVTKARKCIYTHKLKLSFPWCLLRYLFPESQKSGVSKNLVMCWQNNIKLSSSSTLNFYALHPDPVINHYSCSRSVSSEIRTLVFLFTSFQTSRILR